MHPLNSMFRLLLFCGVALLLFSPFASGQQISGLGSKTIPFTVVYKVKPQHGNFRTSGDALAKSLARIAPQSVKKKFPEVSPATFARKAGSPDISRIYELKYPSHLSFAKVKNLLLASGQVEYVEPLYIREPLHQPNDPSSDSTQASSQHQYYLKLINAYAGWAVEKGDTNVVIGILDTGFKLSHEDLIGKVKRNYNDRVDGVDNDGDGYVDNFEGWDFSDNDNNVADDTKFNHGTPVAGAAVASANNGKGIAGVGYNIQFLPLKVYPSTETGYFAGYEALMYAANKGVDVVNISWGGQGASEFEQDVINYAVLEKNVVVVAAGGNTAGKLDIYPASYNNVLSVGGTNSKDIKHSEYTHSYKIDLTAPSIDILTTSGIGNTTYGLARGTSFGSPIVAACAALVKSRFPQLNARQIAERLRVTSDKIYSIPENQPFLEMLGYGRVNLKKALKLSRVKSVRCNSFKLVGKYLPSAGNEAQINTSFINYLDPTDNLEVTLSSVSPYVTIIQNRFNAGSLATMASVSEKTFSFKVTDNAPANTIVTFRLGFKDGTYEDFQYFDIIVNPDYLALDANNLEVTVNSKGNLGYNGFNFNQGEGIKYKDGIPMLFEGGLMIATSATRVSDNIHSEAWVSDEDFVPVQTAKRYQNTPLATQEIRTIMHDSHNTPNEENVGVTVKQVSYAWNDAANKDFIILEYHITNTTGAPFNDLHTGLFADWDIGEYYLNAAKWDEENKLGYVYNVARPFPYAGLKLLTSETPSHYAIDNLGSPTDEMEIENNFTSAEKFKTLSSGVQLNEVGTQGGSNVSHVVGASLKNLKPGETKTIAFALIVSDDLASLKNNAVAAQQKYNSFRTSKTPIAFADTVCVGGKATWSPEGGTKFNFYADANKQQLLGSGASYSIESISQPTTIYAAGIDSVFESSPAPATFSFPLTPEANFTVPENIVVNTPVTFTNTSKQGANWRWNYGGTNEHTEKDLTYTFTEPGTYQIKLTISDSHNCQDTFVIKTVEVKSTTPTSLKDAKASNLQLYPNPTTGSLHIKFVDKPMHSMPQVAVADMLGRTITPPIALHNEEAVADLSGLSEGVYLAHITFDNITIVKRIIILKK